MKQNMDEKELNNQEATELFKAILALKTVSECRNFFRDLCTLSELKAMTERFTVARKIAKGETYRKISKETGASTATITRVAHWLRYGMSGYKTVIDRLRRK